VSRPPMTGPEGLRVLADWFDLRDGDLGFSGDEVQRDLRRSADDMEQAAAEIARLRAYIYGDAGDLERELIDAEIVDGLDA